MKLLRPLLLTLFVGLLAAVSGCYASTYPATGYYSGGYYARPYYSQPTGYYGGGYYGGAGYYNRPVGGVYAAPSYNTYSYRPTGGVSTGYVAAPMGGGGRGAVVVNAR